MLSENVALSAIKPNRWSKGNKSNYYKIMNQFGSFRWSEM